MKQTQFLTEASPDILDKINNIEYLKKSEDDADEEHKNNKKSKDKSADVNSELNINIASDDNNQD